MATTSTHVSEYLDVPAAQVYAFVREPANLPRWALGLTDSPGREVDGRWVAETDAGPLTVDFVPRNGFGVLDHDVTFGSGQTFYNPMRVTPHGDGSELVFSVRRLPGQSDEEHAADVRAVAADLARVRTLLEG